MPATSLPLVLGNGEWVIKRRGNTITRVRSDPRLVLINDHYGQDVPDARPFRSKVPDPSAIDNPALKS